MNVKNIRKFWLLCLVSDVLLKIVVAVYANRILFPLIANNEAASKFKDSVGSSFLSIVVSIVFSLVLYQCAYKKPGTKLLTYSLFCLCLSFIVSIFYLGELQVCVNLAKKLNNHDLLMFSYNAFAIFVLDVGSVIVTLFLSYKLRKANKQIQLEQVFADPAYAASIQQINAATTAEDLALQYGRSVRENPQIASILKKIYKKKSAELL